MYSWEVQMWRSRLSIRIRNPLWIILLKPWFHLMMENRIYWNCRYLFQWGRGDFLWDGNITSEEPSQDLMNSFFLMSKKWGGNRRNEFCIKGLWKCCGTFHVWRSYGNCLYQKTGPFWDLRLVVYWSQKCQWLLLPLLGCWSHFKKLYWCMLREKKGEVLGWNRCWVSAYLVGVTRRKRGDHGAVSCWWAVVAGCYFLVAPVRKSIKDQLTGKVKSDMWVARAGTWQPGSLHGSRMGYLPCLTSCRLLGLYPRARGEHLTSQLLWVAA